MNINRLRSNSVPHRGGREKNITLGERLAVAIIAFIAASLTVAVLGLAAFFVGPVATVQSVKMIALGSVIASSGAGVAGFLLGGERMSYWFSILWGTQEPSEKQLGFILGFIVLVCGAAVFLTLP